MCVGGRDAHAHPILIDGRVADWRGVEPSYEYQPDRRFGRVPIRSAWAVTDGERLLLRFDLDEEASLQRDGDLVLLLDADGNPATGEREGELGVDLRWSFTAGEGRAIVLGLPVRVVAGDIGLVQAPTVSSQRFEIAIDRNARVAGGPLFPGGEAIAVLTAGRGAGAQRTPPLRFADVPPRPPAPPAELAKADPAHLRLLTYNVRFDGLFKRKDRFTRILRALDPDVLLFQEIMNHTPEQTRALVAEMLPGHKWHALGSRRGLIVSRVPVRASGVTGSPRDGVWAILERPGPEWREGPVLVNLHPPCCEDEAGRQEELDSGMAWIREARADGRLGPATPLLIAGDMNLVGHSRQLATLVEGVLVDTARWGPSFDPDVDGTALLDAIPAHQGGREVYTWRNDEGRFPPGRLDYIVYSDALLDIGRSFVLWTPDMSDADLTRYGLRRDDTAEASDHLPVVADFAPRQRSSR
jgi:endonuclease/exonuclease/phosphatase family metal-dependent hydrolase